MTRVLDAVEMGAPWPCGTPAVPALCPPGEANTDLFFDDFEELAGNANDPSLLSHWTSHVLSGGDHWSFTFFGPFATSGTGNAWAYDVNATGDSALEMSTDVTIPAGGAYFQLNHSYGFDNTGTSHWDGGVLEVSTDGGATWADAGGLIVAGASYDGNLSVSTTNPLAGRAAFGGDSFGYTATRLDLAGLAGQDVRFRFHIGTDSVVDDYGWFLDDARIFTCAAACTPDLVITSGTVTSAETRVGCNSITAGTDFGVAGSGELTLQAPSVRLTSGFSVLQGGRLVVSTQ